jgi:hypothetical protein
MRQGFYLSLQYVTYLERPFFPYSSEITKRPAHLKPNPRTYYVTESRTENRIKKTENIYTRVDHWCVCGVAGWLEPWRHTFRRNCRVCGHLRNADGMRD